MKLRIEIEVTPRSVTQPLPSIIRFRLAELAKDIKMVAEREVRENTYGKKSEMKFVSNVEG